METTMKTITNYLTAAIVMVMLAMAAPAHAGFWSSLTSALGFGSGYTSKSAGYNSNTTTIRTTRYVTGPDGKRRAIVSYKVVALSDPRAPSNSQNGYNSYPTTTSTRFGGHTTSGGGCYGQGCN